MEEMGLVLKLQELDLELSRIQAEHDSIPAHMEEIERDHDELSAEIEEQESELKDLKVAIREAESKIAFLDDMSKKYQQQLLTVKTNREYSALLTEIEGVKREKGELEELIIQNMEKNETLSAEIKEKNGRLEELGKQRQSKKDELDLRLKELGKQVAGCKRKREKLTGKVNRPTLRLYERIMNSRVNRAVVPIRSGSCGGCFAHVPLQKVADIRKASQIYTCDSCGRILYYDENQSN
jgi:predicted  nucleic acid-binding Zn-ribbon protein